MALLTISDRTGAALEQLSPPPDRREYSAAASAFLATSFGRSLRSTARLIDFVAFSAPNRRPLRWKTR